jgi:N-acetylglucosamine-6-phosphate deacetylase
MTEQPILLRNAAAITPNGVKERTDILIEKGIVAQISDVQNTDAKIIDAVGLQVFAGFIDIHNHGAVGVDVNSATAEDLRKVSAFLAGQGVTAWLPTFVPDADENYRKVIEAIDEAMETQANEPVAQILGVHYEGVFANEKMCGALRPKFFKTFKNGDEIDSLPKLKKGVHLTTLAPEVENGIELIKELGKQNWIVSIGHTRADTQTLDRAYQAGAKHLTHFYNAMTSLHHRDVGVVGWALTKDDTTFDIIADGVHVHPQMLRFGIESKGAGKVSLISDSVAPTGLGDGSYELWGEKVSVVNGKTQNERGSIAGSVITMLDAARQMRALDFTEWEVSQMASANPARLLGLEKTYGVIETGKRADLVALDEQGNVKLTIIGGKTQTGVTG